MTSAGTGATHGAVEVSRFGAWLVVRFPSPHLVASWAIVGGALRQAGAVVWRRVEERELRPPVDAARWLSERMAREGLGEAVGLLTGGDLDARVEARCVAGDIGAHCLATVGLSNALRAGDPPGPSARIGTINALVCVDAALTAKALLEGLSIATEAKTAALIELGVTSRLTGLPATGTGTDCFVIAAPLAPRPTPYAGKHTEVGSAIGAAVLEAVRAGVRGWRIARGAG